MNMLRLTREVTASVDAQAVMAAMLWRAGRDAPVREREAIAAVVVTRARLSGIRNFADAILTACQQLEEPTLSDDGVVEVGRDARTGTRPTDTRTNDVRIQACCKRIARRAVMGVLDDPTAGATHFHRESVCPSWSRGRFPDAWFGARLFYKLEG